MESRVGLLVIAALIVFGWLTVQSGSFGIGSLGREMRPLTTTVSDAQGIQRGSLVRVAGVRVGEVTDLTLLPTGQAQLTMAVDKNVPLPAETTAQLTTNGLIGERFVALIPSAVPSGQLLAAEATSIPSSSNPGIQEIGNSFAQVGGDLESVAATLRQVLGNPENAQKLQSIIDGLATLGTGLDSNGGEIIANLRDASASLKTILDDNQQNANAAISNISTVADNLAVITDRLRNGEGPLGQLLMADSSSTTGNPMGDLQSALRDLRETMAKINNGEGTIGKLVNDPQTAEKLDNALDTFSTVANRLEQTRTEVSFEGRSLLTEDSVSKGEFGLMFQPRPTRFYYGAIVADGFASRADDNDDPGNPYFGQDFGDDIKYTAQFGQIYQNALYGRDVAVRIGLKDSTAGLGVDTYAAVPYLNREAKLSADLYDFSGDNLPGADNPQLDLRARIDLLGNTLYGVAGWDNVLNGRYSSPVVGVGLRFQDDDLKYLAGQAL